MVRMRFREGTRFTQGHTAEPGAQPLLTLRAMGPISSLMLTPDSTIPHCSSGPFPAALQARAAPSSFPLPSGSETFPEPVYRPRSDLSPLSLPVYSTPWQKAPEGEFMRMGGKWGEKGWGDEYGLMKKKEERAGKRAFKEKATQDVFV